MLMPEFLFRGFINHVYRLIDILTSIISGGLLLSTVCGMMVPHTVLKKSVKNSMIDTDSVVEF